MIATAEQDELRHTVRTLLARTPTPRPAPGEPVPFGEPVWRLLADQVGACGLAVPEAYGGAGFTVAETHIVCEEIGRALAPIPYLSSAVLTTQALLACGSPDALAELPGLAAGTTVGTLAWAEQGSWGSAAIRTTAVSDRLTGAKEYVLDGGHADLFVVPARTETGRLALYQVRKETPGVAVEPVTTLDTTRPLARLVLRDAPAQRLSDDGAPILEHLLAVAATALSAEQLGGAQHCLDLTVHYAKTRVQFGRPIGSFQAVKHRLADLYVLVESARSASYDAARAVAGKEPDAAVRASLAQAYSAETFSLVAGETIQLHGGIGFTWEHDAHLYFKRAHGAAQLFGDAAWHRRRLASKALSATA